MEISEDYGPYRIVSSQKKAYNGRYSVGVRIFREVDSQLKTHHFKAEDKILYILEVEAAKEGINLGKNLIDRGLVGF